MKIVLKDLRFVLRDNDLQYILEFPETAYTSELEAINAAKHGESIVSYATLKKMIDENLYWSYFRGE